MALPHEPTMSPEVMAYRALQLWHEYLALVRPECTQDAYRVFLELQRLHIDHAMSQFREGQRAAVTLLTTPPVDTALDDPAPVPEPIH